MNKVIFTISITENIIRQLKNDYESKVNRYRPIAVTYRLPVLNFSLFSPSPREWSFDLFRLPAKSFLTAIHSEANLTDVVGKNLGTLPFIC